MDADANAGDSIALRCSGELKIVSEVVAKKNLHTDIVEELKLLKEAFEDEEEEVLKRILMAIYKK